MIFSKNTGKYYGLTLKDIALEDLSKKIGSQLGEVEWSKDWGDRYEGIVVAEIIKCQKHPNADKLQVCLINDNGVTEGVERDSEGLAEVVCGAPNARAGITVVWVPPKATVPATFDDEEPFVISARELRGVVSNGMLVSLKELGISNEHDGILEINKDEVGKELAKPGTPFKQLYNLDDQLINIENKMFTHRPDCFGNLGISREVAAILQQPFNSPDWYMEPVKLDLQESGMELTVTNGVKDEVPRFTVLTLDKLSNDSSPIWLQAYLSRVGIKPVSKIVDFSNYYMMLTSQPTHAFDYDKVAELSGDKAVLGVRLAKEGEKLTLLGGKQITLTDKDLVIATDKQPIALAGIMGGNQTEVDENTKRIIIECATFDMYTIRRSTMRHGIFTDAANRYTKGQNPHQNEQVVKKLATDLGGVPIQYQEASVDKLPQNKPVEVTAEFINSRLGTNLKIDQIKTMLENAEFIIEADNDKLTVTAPFWRMDIEIPEDIIEEVGRLYGYDNLPLELPKRSIKPTKVDKLLAGKTRMRLALANAGANELLTHSFVDGRLLDAVDQPPENAYTITNALSPQLQYYRQTLTPSLLEKVKPNIKAGQNEFALFEIARTHSKAHQAKDEDGLPEEIETTALVYASKKAKEGAAFYQVRAYLDELARRFGLELNYQPITKDPGFMMTKPFDIERSALVMVENKIFGIIGEYRMGVISKLKLPKYCAGFELDTVGFTGHEPASPYSGVLQYPSSTQDLTIQVDYDLPYQQIEQEVKQALAGSALESSFNLISIFSANNSDSKNITFSIKITSVSKTLTTDEVSQVISQVIKSLSEKFNARQI